MATDEVWKKRMQRETVSRHEAERLLEEKSQILWQANNELQKLTSNLENMVTERTLALSDALVEAELRKCQLEETNRQLELAKRAAEQSSQIKSNFLANISHEIRTPLNSIISFTHLLQEKVRDINAIEYLDKINFASHHLLSLINNIIDTAKIESETLSLSLSPFIFAELLEDIVFSSVCEAENKGVEFYLKLDAGLPNLLIADKERLRQIITVFTSNAIKFTHQGQIVLRISLVEKTEQDVVLLFNIEDTGIGIETSQMKNIFDNFYQADNGISRRFEGSGLGLALAKKLIELMDGKLNVKSTPKVGSEFSFSLKLHCLPVLDIRDLPNRHQEEHFTISTPMINGFDHKLSLINLLQSNYLYHRSLLELNRLSIKFYDILVSVEEQTIALNDIINKKLKEKLTDICYRLTTISAINIEKKCQEYLENIANGQIISSQQWQKLWQDLNLYFSKESFDDTSDEQIVDKFELQNLTKHLLQLLENGDANAIEYVETNKQVFTSALNSHFKDFNQDLQNFEFEQAANLLRQAINL